MSWRGGGPREPHRLNQAKGKVLWGMKGWRGDKDMGTLMGDKWDSPV